MANTENDLFSSGFVLPEHRGGDGWTILHGDALDIIPHFQPGAFDAVITDPPYAGGGAKPSEKTRTTNQKYSSMSADKALPDFDGNQKDQLSWMLWTAVWMSKARAACKPGAPICVFIDWRQLPALSCAMQWAGWIWRGVAGSGFSVTWMRLAGLACRNTPGRQPTLRCIGMGPLEPQTINSACWR